MRDPKPQNKDRKDPRGSVRGRAISHHDVEEITKRIDRVQELVEKSQEERPASIILPAPTPVISKTPPALIALQRRVGQVVIALGVGVVGYLVRDCEARFGIPVSQVLPWPSEPPTRPEPWKGRDGGMIP
jgi:hypothetical protein